MIPSVARTPAVHAVAAAVAAGALTYVILALVSRTVNAHAFDQFSVFWSTALIIGFGFFLPVEQEAARVGRSAHSREDVRAAMMVTTALLIVGVGVMVLVSAPLLEGGLDLTPGLALTCVAIVVASGVQFAGRGALLIGSRARAFANTLLLDAGLRVALLGAVALAAWAARTVVDASTWYAIALVAAIVIAHGWAVPWRSWRGDARIRTAYVKAVMVLAATNLLAQVLVNSGPILVQAFGSATGAAGAFQASSTIARIPLAVVTPIQAMLVGPLVTLALAHEEHALRRVVLRVGAGAGVLAIIGAVVGWFTGPWAVELIFGPGRALAGPDMALLISSVIVHVALIVFTQAIIATGRHLTTLVTWTVAVAVAVAVFAATVSTGVVLAVELGFGLGSLAGVVLALGALFGTARPSRPTEEH